MAEPGMPAAKVAGQLSMGIDASGNAQHIVVGTLADTAWDGAGNPTSLIALLKGLYAKLDEIATNTAA